ncbi:MAG: helix-turn-helix domain-containing protein [Hyphomonas sp.]|nr:helix-turn-helix domain-containing protein [Hyphomonas sp.]
MSKPHDNSMDIQIGQRIKRARLEAAVTQQELGEILGRSSQQIHKYEQGSNRVSAGTLYTIAQVLDRSLDWFFSGVEHGAVSGLSNRSH